MSKINKVLYNVDQTTGTNGTTADERKLARKNIGLDEVVGHAATASESGIAPLDAEGKIPSSCLPAHAHGNISNDGKIGSTSGLPLVTTTDGLVTTGAFGTAAGQFASGNHTHGHITNDGKLENRYGELEPVLVAEDGTIGLGLFGSAANAVARGNHGHGNIANDGKVTAAIANNEVPKCILVTRDESSEHENEVACGPAFGNDTSKFLNQAGEWVNVGVATDRSVGGIMLGYTSSGKNYAVELDHNMAYVNVPWTEYTAGTDVKISNQNAISSLHGLKSYSRTQPIGNYGDMVEDDLISGIYHICPPTIVNNEKKNNLVYEYKVTDITNAIYIDLRNPMTPDADGFVPNLHYIIDLTGEITDDSDPALVRRPHDSLTLSMGYGNPKAMIANYYVRYIPIYIGHKYLVDFYGNVAHVNVLGENRVQDIAPNWGDVQEYLITDPNTTHHNISYKLDSHTVYHMDIYTNGLQAESTDKYRYRVALGVYGSGNIRYLTGWIRQDSGKAIQPHLDFTSDIFTSMFIEFDQADYPMAEQSVNLMIMGTKERM